MKEMDPSSVAGHQTNKNATTPTLSPWTSGQCTATCCIARSRTWWWWWVWGYHMAGSRGQDAFSSRKSSSSASLTRRR